MSQFLETRSDDELDALRRGATAEQERRQKLHEGRERIGQAVCEYLEAAKLPPPADTHTEMGDLIISLLADAQETTE